MKVLVAQTKNQRLSNTKTIKNKNSGIKSLSIKNTPFISPKINKFESHQKYHLDDQKLQFQALNTLQKNNSKSEEQNQIILSLFQKCLRPQIPSIIHNSYQTDSLDSKIIFKINQKPISIQIKHQRPKSSGIKIGNKPQNYRLSNKSEPKKVQNLTNLSSNYQKVHPQNNKQQIESQDQNKKRTQRKINTSILFPKKNSPQITEFESRLKKFNQDLKKTKKPKILTLDLNSTEKNLGLKLNANKNYIGLKNHQIMVKQSPISSKNILISPQFNKRKHIIPEEEIQTINKNSFTKDKLGTKQSINSLQKTKKIVNYTPQQIKLYQPLYRQKRAEIKEKDEKFNLDQLLPKQEIQFVLERFKKNPFKNSLIQETIDPSQEILNISIGQVSCENLHDIDINSNKNQCKISSYRKIQSQNHKIKHIDNLRATDYGLKIQLKQQVQSPVSQRRSKPVFKTKSKQTSEQNKLKSLNQGAKTIITKYDSSDKRSIVEQSIILFQCSRDLKPSFIRQNLNHNQFAPIYQGSLAIETQINENNEQQFLGNSISENNFTNQNFNVFDSILATPNPTNSKLKKSYSIKQMDNSHF